MKREAGSQSSGPPRNNTSLILITPPPPPIDTIKGRQRPFFCQDENGVAKWYKNIGTDLLIKMLKV
jgi:hypothetical protein